MELICCIAAIGFHLGSLHIASVSDQLNPINPGVYLRFSSGVIAGTFLNSRDRQSTYIGYEIPIANASLVVGGITGYGKIKPLIAPSILIPVDEHAGFRLSYLPKMKFTGAHVVNFALEYRF